MDSSDLQSHLNRVVILRFRDGEEVSAVLLAVDTVSEALTYEVKDVLKAGSPRSKGTQIGTTYVARLDDLMSFAARL